ncbi:ATP-binding protein [Limnospira fusiformis KN01]|uniref:AAA family ATPase n=1 Tax=Limnospira fusiformis TaxID=54297 RepID=UPI001CA6C969|nr:ATP-binding protein [Limnospira fusiformis]ULB46041.1 ATP-binding protein [Limnospira fusiformis KN01]
MKKIKKYLYFYPNIKNVEDILQWADRLILDKTRENLTSIEEAILTGVWSGKKYPQIATEYKCSESHVKKEAAKLWEKLREELGEDLNKYNFRSKVQKKYRVSQSPQSGHCLQVDVDTVNQFDTVNIGHQFVQSIKDTQHRSPSSPDSSPNSSPDSSPTQNPSPIIDLIDAPDLTDFDNRTTELNTLKQWILQDRRRLITIYGLSGIGKSVLTRQLIEQIQPEFDYICWKSLTETPTFSSLKNQLQQFFDQSQNPPFPTIIDYFRHCRCLVILDDLHNLFKSGALAGEYLTDFKEYRTIFRKIAKNHHQSCVILLSWEKPRAIATLEAETHSTRTLHLKGLSADAEEILRSHQLTDSDKWPELINLYQGHPTWLNIIASTIVELFDGSVSLFLSHSEDIFLGDLEPILESQLERLSQLEQQVISGFRENQAIALSEQPTNPELSPSELWSAIQSLVRRGLLEKISEGERGMFQLHPIWQQYLKFKLS